MSLEPQPTDYSTLERRLTELESQLKDWAGPFSKACGSVDQFTVTLSHLQQITTNIHDRLVGNLSSTTEGLIPSHQAIVHKVGALELEVGRIDRQLGDMSKWMHGIEMEELRFKAAREEHTDFRREIKELSDGLQELHDTKMMGKGWILGASAVASVLTILIGHMLGFVSSKNEPAKTYSPSTVGGVTNVAFP